MGRVTAHVHSVLSRQDVSGRHVELALSGGADSVALFDVLCTLRAPLQFSLSTLHVNHGISPHAAEWARFCSRLCHACGVPLEVVAVQVDRSSGAGLEAAARAARYGVFGARRCDVLVLAQHRDDQAETLLLQLLRGAGVKGLAGMPELRPREPHDSRPPILRPLLGLARADALAYLEARGLSWVEDESNGDTAYDRNFLRHELLPVLDRRYPAARETLARSAAHLGEAAALLDDLAALDAEGAVRDGGLAVERLRSLSRARAKNLLRWFVFRRGHVPPNAARLEESLQQALDARQDAGVCVAWGEIELRRFRGQLYLERRWEAPRPDWQARWGGESRLPLPELRGALRFTAASGEGLSVSRLAAAPVTIRLRRGGERLCPEPGRPGRTLKNLLQEAGIAPWRRERLPLLYCGDELAWAGGIGADRRWAAAPGEAGWRVCWEESDQQE